MIKKTTKRVRKRSRDFSGERFARLAATGEQVFHAGDLANLWDIRRRETLYMTLSRYTAAGLLFRVYKGLYAIKQPNELDPYLLGVKALHAPAYVSCESVLFKNGAINQLPSEVTLVSTVSKRLTVAGTRFRSRKLRDIFLFNDTGIETKNGVRVATLPRAMADMLYFYPKKYFDAGNSKIIPWPKVRKIATAVGYPVNK